MTISTTICRLVQALKCLISGIAASVCCYWCRLWYENAGVFTASQLVELRQASLARIICDNSDAIRQVPHDVFLFLPSLPDGQVSCDDIPRVDLKVWAQCCQGTPFSSTACSLRRVHSCTRLQRLESDHV